MSDLYIKLDDAVERVILLSQQNGNLAEYAKTPEDKEWLRNELEQVCECPSPDRKLLNIIREFYEENWKAANEYFAKAGNPDDHHTTMDMVKSVCIRSEGIGRAAANMFLLDILRQHNVDIFGEVKSTND